jgi:hypothetical protein
MMLEKHIGKENLTYFIFTHMGSVYKGYDLQFKGTFQQKNQNVLKKMTDDLTFVRMDEIKGLTYSTPVVGLKHGFFTVDNYCFKARFMFIEKDNEIIKFVIAKTGSQNIDDGLIIVDKLD